MGSRRHLAVDLVTFNLVMDNCIKEFLRYNPEFKGMHISQNHIVRRIAEHYIESAGV